MSDFEARITAKLDTSKFEQQMNKLQNKKFNVNVDTTNALQRLTALRRELDELINAANNIRVNLANGNSTNNVFNNVVNQGTYAYRQLLDIQRRIGNISIKLNGLDTTKNTNQISVLSRQLNQLRADYQALQRIFDVHLNTDQMGRIQTVIEDTELKLEELNAKMTDTKNNLANSINVQMNNGKFKSEISDISVQISKLSGEYANINSLSAELNNNLRAMENSRTPEQLTTAYQNYENTLKRIKNELKEVANQEKITNNASTLQQQKNNLSLGMDVWLKKNSAAAKEFGTRIQELQAELKTCDATRLNGIKAEFQAITKEATIAGKSTLSFSDKLSAQIKRLSAYFSATMLFMESARAIRAMYDNVLDVDTAMTELYRVTDLTDSQYDKLYADMISGAKAYASTLDTIINSTAEWVRLGFDADTAEQLAEISTMYQNVTDLDESTANENLVTAYKGFEKQLLELNNNDSTAAIEMITDIYDKLGNEFAESAADVGDGLSKSASVLSQGGASIQEAAGMFTGIQEVLQNSSTSGTALKILTLRIRGMRGELEELGEEVDDNVDSISKIQTQILNLTHGKVNIFDNEGNFRNIYDVMADISKIYNELSDTDRASLLEIIAGKNRANAVQALINNWGNVEKATEAAYNSAGTAYAENEKYLNSLKGHIAQLETTWQSLSNDVLDSEFVKGLVDGLANVLDTTDDIVNTVGTLPTLLAGIAAALSLIKNKGIFTVDDSNKIQLLGNNLAGTKTRISELSLAMQRYNNVSSKSASFQASYNQSLQNSKSSMAQYLRSLNGANASLSGYAAYLLKAKVATIALRVASAALNTVVTMGISWAISALISKIGELINAEETAYNQAKEVAEASREKVENISDEQNSLSELIEKYKELAKSDMTDSTNRAEIKDIQDEITKLVGAQADNLDLVNGKLDEELAKLKDIQSTQLQTNISTFEKAYVDAADEASKKTFHEGNIVSDWNDDNNVITFDYWGDDENRDKAAEIIDKVWKEKGYGSAFVDYEEYILGFGDRFTKLIFNADLTLQDKINAINDAIDALENTDGFDYNNNQTWKKLVEIKDALAGGEGVFTKQVEAAKTLLDELTMSEVANNNADIDSLEDYEKYRQEIIDNITNNKTISQAIKDKALSSDAIETEVDNYLGTLEGFSKYYNEWYDKFASDTAKGAEEVKNRFRKSIESDTNNFNFPNLNSKASGIEIFTNPELTFPIPKLSDEAKQEINDFNNWIDSLSNSDKDIVYKISTDFTSANVENQLKNLSEGGTVDLTLRPTVDNSELKKAGWDVSSDGTATVFTSTFSNSDGSVAINFTPIVTDEKGNYKETLSPEALQKYAEGVINGTREDDLKLQIGAEFTGDDAINQAVKAAEKIHLLQDYFYLKGDPSNFSLDDWKIAVEDYKSYAKEIGESVGGAFENLISAKGDKDNPEFIDRVDDYVDSISALDDAFEKFQKGELENKDIVKLIEDFPQLTGRTEDLDVAINELKGNLNNTMLADFAEQFGKMETEEDVAKLEAFQNQVLELGGVVGSTAFSIDIDVEADNMDKLYSAMKESVTSTGLTADSIQNLTNRYQNLKDFNANELFEKTANGIHLNTKELRQLESEYENQIKTANNLELLSLTSQYENLTEQIKNCDDATKVADLYAKRQDILDQIDDTATLAAQYDGLTSSFKKWEEAQSLGEEGDMYDSLQGGLEHIKELYDEGLIGTNEFRTAVQLMSNEDLSTASIDELLAAYDKGYEKMTRYFTESSDGCLNFLNDVSQLNSEWVKLNDDGSWDINFGVGDDADVAKKLGLDIETVQAIMRKLSDYGFDINLDSIFTKLDYLQDELTTATDKLKELGLTKTNFDFDTNSIKDVNSQIDEAQKLVDGFKDKKGKIDLSVEGAMESETVLIGLMNRKQELSAPTVMHVDVSEANDDITNLISYLKDYQTNYNDIELKTAIGADTSEAETNIGETLTKINEIPKEVKTKLGLDDKDFTDAVSNIQADVEAGVSPKQEDLDTVQETISNISPEMMVKAGLDSSRIDNYEPKDKTASVEYTSPSGQAIKDYQNSIDKWQPQSKTATITYNPVVNSLGGSITSWISGLFNGGSKANGTAYVNGTAKAKGDWRTKEDGEALGGELGQEMVVRDGRFFTIGDNGAEFFKYKKNDIIFSAEQTRQILKYGKITSGKKRGTALAEGTAFSSGSGKITAKGNVITTPSGSNNSDSSNSKDSSGNSTQTIDYIEIAIDRVQRAVNKLKKVAESAFKSLKKRLNATSDEIEKINEQIAVQNTAYSAYMAKANSINLSSSIKQAVRNGSYSITDYDSDTASLISEYKQYYEAALDCKEAVQDLNDELAQLYKDKFDLIEQDFDNQLSRMENKANRMESKISLLEAQNYFVSSKYYKKLANQEQDNIAMLNDKYAGLQEALDEAVNSGKISKYSEEWYNMTIAIEDTKAAIDDATVSLAEYEDKMREIDWSVFDYLQDRISQINSESDFLIDLMSNSDMFDDVGNFTDKGLATAGLHGVNYNTYMAQADKYAKELISIQNQLADDPADTRLIERKEELLELQQQSIKNAEEEKQAIKSLVEDGIKVQLESLQDLIDTYTDSLDKAKSFYDYQNKIEDKTSAIAEIQKQLAAYENNVSEETQVKVQKLKIDLVDAQKELAETEYEQYISDTKQLLDTLYDEYETILNERLDNIDMLMEDMIDTINLNSGDISATLRETGESVGYTLTDNMTDIWSSGITSSNNVISMYGDNFSNTLTSLNETLNNIAAGVDIITGGRSSSKKTTTTQPTTTANKTNTKSNTTKTNSNNSNTKQGNGKGEIGDKVTYVSGIYYENSAGGGRWGNQYLGKSVYITSTNPGSAYPYHISTGKTLGNGDLGWVKLNQLKGYKTGGLVDYTGLAQLDGTPDKPELVLNSQDTENFVSLRDTLRKMSEQPLSVWGNNVYSSFGTPPITAFTFKNFEKKIAELRTPTQSVNQNNEINVTIPIDHVQDYNEMLEQMKKDSKFENMIKAIGITPLTGGSSLAKNNIHWD